jgi:hypothetical protein
MDELLDIGWAAGIIDGEGEIGLSDHKYPLVRVAMTCPLAPRKLLEFFGMGSINEWPIASGKIDYTWRVSGNEALAVIQTVRPFLITKRAAADRVAAGRKLGAGVIVKDLKTAYRIRSAWAAGIIDGEGNIDLERPRRRSTRYQPVVNVRMTHFETVCTMHQHFGMGQVNPVRRVQPDHWLPQLKWRAVCSDAICVLKECIPHMVTKSARARLVLEATDLHGYM